MPRHGDGAFVNATVLPMTDPAASTEAIAWKNGRILAVGSSKDIKALAALEGLAIEDLDGRVVLPGFVDAHMHFLHVGVRRMRPDVGPATSLADALERCEDWLRTHPESASGDDGGPGVIADGWDESAWPEGRGPTREELDTLSARPFVMRRIDGHYAVANTPALAIIRPRWDRDDRVDMETGVLLEDASLYLNEVMPATDAQLDEAVQIACGIAKERGVTAVGDYSQAPFRAALLRAAANDHLSTRVASSIYVQDLAEETGYGFRTGTRRGEGSDGRDEPAEAAADTDWIRDGGVKVFLDGSFGGHTAWLHKPYYGLEHGGAPIWTDDQAIDHFRRAHAAGVQIHAHAIGDAAIDQALLALQRLPDPETIRVERHRIEHFELPTEEAVATAAALGVVASCQPNFVGAWSSKGGMYEERLGSRFARNNRYRTWLDAGLELAFGSDGMPFGPLVGIDAAVRHPVQEERLTPEEAVWLYTHRAAWSLHWDDAIGTLELGKYADLLVLGQRSLGGSPPNLWTVDRVLMAGAPGEVETSEGAEISDPSVASP